MTQKLLCKQSIAINKFHFIFDVEAGEVKEGRMKKCHLQTLL